MAGRPFEYIFTANDTELAATLRAISGRLEDTGRELSDVSEDGARDTEKITDALREVADTAEDTGRRIGTEIEDGTDKASRGARGLADDVSGDLASSFKDFDGTAAGSLEAVSGGLEGIASLIPGIGGLLAGLAAAGLAGLVESVNEDAEEIETRTQSMYDAMLESGQNFLTATDLQDAVEKILGEPGKLEEVKKAAEDLGLPFETVASAYAGWGDAIGEVSNRADELADKEANAFKSGDEISGRVIARYQEIQRSVDSVGDSVDAAGARSDAVRSTVDKYAAAWEAVDVKAGDAKSTIDGIVDKTVKVTAEVDTSAIDRALSNPRTFNVEVAGYSRAGNRVF